MKVDARK